MNALVKRAAKIGLTCLALIAGSSVLVADDTPPQATVSANESGIPLGVPCHVHTVCGGLCETQFAKIVKVTPEWVVLDLQHEKPLMAAKLPYVERQFKNTRDSLSTGEDQVWVPRSSIAKVVVHPLQSISISRHRQLGEAKAMTQNGATVDARRQRHFLHSYAQSGPSGIEHVHDEDRLIAAPGMLNGSPLPGGGPTRLKMVPVGFETAPTGTVELRMAPLNQHDLELDQRVCRFKEPQHAALSENPEDQAGPAGTFHFQPTPPASLRHHRTTHCTESDIESISFQGELTNYATFLSGLLSGQPISRAKEANTGTPPSVYYLRDDVQYFPHGPEFKLSRHVEAIEEHRKRTSTRQPPARPQSKPQEKPNRKLREKKTEDTNGASVRGWAYLQVLAYLIGGQPQIETKPGQPGVSLSKAYYIRGPLQCFPAGPEFKLNRTVESIEENELAAFFAARSVSDGASQVELERIGIDFDYNDHVEQQRKRTSPKRLPSLPRAKPLPLKESAACGPRRDANASSPRLSSAEEWVYQPTARLISVPYVGRGPVFQTGWRRDPAAATQKAPYAARLRTLYDGNLNTEEFIHKRLLSDAAYPDFAESIGVVVEPPIVNPKKIPPPIELAPPKQQAGLKEAGLKRIKLKPTVTCGLWTQTRGQDAYVGTIEQVEEERILIRAVLQEGRSSKTYTLLSDIPFIARNFLRNTGVGVMRLNNKEVWIEKDEIESIENEELPPALRPPL